MSEVEVVSTQEQSSEHVASPGQMLREAREARQMSIPTLASALKVPVAKLQALEEDRWDVLTDKVFTRALALSVCRVLQIDSVPILALLPKAGAAKLSTNPEGINEPFKEKTLRSSMSSGSDGAGSGAVKVLAALLIAAAGAAAIYFVPQWGQESSVEGAQDQTQIAASGTGEVLVSTPEPLVISDPAAQASPVGEVAAQAITEAPVVTSNVRTAQAQTGSDNVAQAIQPAPVQEAEPAATGAVLRFSATGETWVQVRNAQQQVVLEKILKAGDVYEQASPGRPLHVVIGNADVTRLEVDGAAFDWTGTTKNNVARFEVK